MSNYSKMCFVCRELTPVQTICNEPVLCTLCRRAILRMREQLEKETDIERN